ncbi:hypothetical protein D0809_05545 [Flavobacterium circumlabens]|uniref:Uncharacterized protein n=1 Tax=Flavobacterium circumlabens TaxID=2133765 RepID=A0A4Y7UE60_9FLAO|nr:hypothetical protein D0809_05545 [Flavobacterium circumlabens]
MSVIYGENSWHFVIFIKDRKENAQTGKEIFHFTKKIRFDFSKRTSTKYLKPKKMGLSTK